MGVVNVRQQGKVFGCLGVSTLLTCIQESEEKELTLFVNFAAVGRNKRLFKAARESDLALSFLAKSVARFFNRTTRSVTRTDESCARYGKSQRLLEEIEAMDLSAINDRD
jgi:hypothetical protein